MTKLQSKLYMGLDMKEEYNPVIKKQSTKREDKKNSLRMEGTAFIGSMIKPEEEISIKKKDLLMALRSGRKVLEENRENIKATLSPELEKDFKFMFQKLKEFKSLSSKKARNKQSNIKSNVKGIKQGLKERPEDYDMYTIAETEYKEIELLIEEMNRLLGIK